MPNVSLTPELEGFAAQCVASGRYANVSEVTRAALRLLQQTEHRRQDFLAMLGAAEAAGEAEGFIGPDPLGAELDAAIQEAGEGIIDGG
ncbi:MAG: type II toxin-antitoxin system ParD family antitoxin [Pseudomonadota bacterium]|nr:type II toxin-antitoxin system ParD family antitoxin [Pseudomonadota bacterium]